ncbi:MAG: branched-chain amino acid ABC transporter permease [Parvibaculaceae bacterium]
MLSLLNGAMEPGRRPLFWIGALALLTVAAAAPFFVGRYMLLNLNSFLLMTFLTMGLALLWGFTGILSLGQSAFLGIGGYAYGVAAINLAGIGGQTGLAFVCGIGAALAAALVLSWIMFYGRLKGVYVAIITLVVALLLETFLSQTAGPQWSIGAAHLGGNNGLGRFSGDIQDLPSLALGPLELAGTSKAFYFTGIVLIAAIYLGLRMLVNSRFGIALTAIREDPERTESLGYDVRLLQTVVFCLGAGLAALSGILYVSWGNFITPSVFGVTANILPVIWVAVAGRKSLAASIVGAVLLQWISQALALQGEYALVLQGALLVIAVLLMPEGLISVGGSIRRAPHRTRLERGKARPLARDGHAP